MRYLIDFDHIRNILIARELNRISTKDVDDLSQDIVSKLKVFYKTIELIGNQLLRCQINHAYKLYKSLENQANTLLSQLNILITDKEQKQHSQLIQEANWSFTFYRTIFYRLLNSFYRVIQRSFDKS